VKYTISIIAVVYFGTAHAGIVARVVLPPVKHRLVKEVTHYESPTHNTLTCEYYAHGVCIVNGQYVTPLQFTLDSGYIFITSYVVVNTATGKAYVLEVQR
jgi:hypothetical protein